MLVARTTIGSAPRTSLIWVRVRESGFKRRSRPPKSMDEDPFTCFRKQSKPSCYYIPAILNSHSGASTIKTLFQRRSNGSVLGTYYDEPVPSKKLGKVENIFCFWRNSGNKWIWYAEVYELLGSAVDMLFLPSFKIYSSSKKCSATWAWYYTYIMYVCISCMSCTVS